MSQEQNQDKPEWELLSKNQNAIHFLEQNQDKINWDCLSKNQNAILLQQHNLDKIDWESLSGKPKEASSRSAITISLFTTVGLLLLSRRTKSM